MAEFELFETMYSAGWIRRLRPDPVPDDVITKILDAAIRAPSGSNAQSWLFMVVKDAGKRKQLGAVTRQASEILMKLYANAPRPEHMDEKKHARFMQSVQHLFDHMGDALVLLLPCLKASMWAGEYEPARRHQDSPGNSSARIAGSSIYPAVQNIILACRAYGLGTVADHHSRSFRG